VGGRALWPAGAPGLARAAARAAVREGGVGRSLDKTGRRQGRDLAGRVVRWERSNQRGGNGGGQELPTGLRSLARPITRVEAFERRSKRVTLFEKMFGRQVLALNFDL
jgi:hypothetical protein